VTRNTHAHDAISKWLPKIPQDQEFFVRDLYQMAVAHGVNCGFATLIAHLQAALPSGVVTSPQRGVYAIHARSGQPGLFVAPASPIQLEVSLSTLHYQNVLILDEIRKLRAIVEGGSNAKE
jgi:hypothetical protein